MAKTRRTFAQEANIIMKKYEPRLGPDFDRNDKLALEAMNQELGGLKRRQERERVSKLIREGNDQMLEAALQGEGQSQGLPMNAYGGEIPQKPSLSSTGLAAGKKPSQYNEEQLRLGIEVEFEHTKNKSLAMKIAMDHLEENPMYYGTGDKAQAEQSAQQHAAADAQSYEMGGGLPMYYPGGTLGDPPFVNKPNEYVGQKPISSKVNGVDDSWQYLTTTHKGPTIGSNNTPQSQSSLGRAMNQNAGIQGITSGDFNPTWQPTADEALSDMGSIELGSQGGFNDRMANWWEGLSAKEGDPYSTRVNPLQHGLAAAGDIFANRNIDFDDNGVNRIQPREISLQRQREQNKRDRDIAQSMIRRQAAQSGSQAQTMNNIIAGATNTQRVKGRADSESYMNEEVTNAKFGQFADQINFQGDMYNSRMKREQELINQQRKDARSRAGFDAGQGYLQDRSDAARWDQMHDIMIPENFEYQAGPGDSPVKRILGIQNRGKMVNTNPTDITGNPLPEEESNGMSALQRAWSYMDMLRGAGAKP